MTEIMISGLDIIKTEAGLDVTEQLSLTGFCSQTVQPVIDLKCTALQSVLCFPLYSM